MKIGVAFSGGGARGVAHIGVIKAFEENNINIDIVSGTSAGSIVAALYANGLNSGEMLEFVKDTTIFKFFSVRMPMGGLVKTTILEEKLLKMIPHNDFSKLKIPLKIAVTNLTKGVPEIISSGSIVDAVIPSCSIPIIFPPYHIDNQVYTDGGLMMNLPARILRDECNLLIGSNLIPFADIENHEIRTIKEVGIRCFDLVVNQNSIIDVNVCDLIINHFGLRNMTLLSISKAEEIFMIGYESTMKIMPKLLEILNNKN